MNYGFVYMLYNTHMTCVKIGCTERSPHARAEELSKPTGVPSPFVVACYVEVKDFQEFERKLHGWLKDYRVNESREFFSGAAVRFAVAIMVHWPDRLAFTEVDPEFLSEHLECPAEFFPDPWSPAPKTEVVEHAPALRVVGSAERGFE